MTEIKWQKPLGLHDTVNFIPMGIRSMGYVPSEQEMLVLVGQIAGECYNSSMTDYACINRALSCVGRGHHSPWEHVHITLNCIVDRGTSHALVRHRHCAFQQSSTIYQKYKDFINIIALPETDPCNGESVPGISDIEIVGYQDLADVYNSCINSKMQPGRARDILPNALATNLIITANMRQWMYMLKRRIGPGDAVRMHVWETITYDWFKARYRRIVQAFDDWYEKHPL